MILFSAPHLSPLGWCIAGLDALSAFLGMAGTYFMSKRYAKTFVSGAFFALIGLFRYLIGKGESVRKFYSAEARANCDVPESPADMAFGLSLLFLAFLLQVARIAISAWFAKS